MSNDPHWRPADWPEGYEPPKPKETWPLTILATALIWLVPIAGAILLLWFLGVIH